MEDKFVGDGVYDVPNASLSEGGAEWLLDCDYRSFRCHSSNMAERHIPEIIRCGDGGSFSAQTSANETPSVCPADSQLPQGGRQDPIEPECKASPWYVDLTREEFVAFRMLTSRLIGPLRQRWLALGVSVVCFGLMAGLAVYEWVTKLVPYPDPSLVVGALVALIPALIFCVYVPLRIKKNAGKQYDRSVQGGMDFCGELFIYPDCIEKMGQTLTASIRLDNRMLFIETADMMVITALNSPAIVLPARCLTDEMARAVRQAVEHIPPRNRRFIARVQARGEAVAPPKPSQKPEELWVSTFTYTAEEYMVVVKGLIGQHFWRMSPLYAAMSMLGACYFSFDGKSIDPLRCVLFFLLLAGLMLLFNLVLPQKRVKQQVPAMSAHDLTMQVRFDTVVLHQKLPKGGQNWVLWCDVDHVYEQEEFVEIVHNKRASLFIPKRCIDDLDAFDAAVKRCRGEQ